MVDILIFLSNITTLYFTLIASNAHANEAELHMIKTEIAVTAVTGFLIFPLSYMFLHKHFSNASISVALTDLYSFK